MALSARFQELVQERAKRMPIAEPAGRVNAPQSGVNRKPTVDTPRSKLGGKEDFPNPAAVKNRITLRIDASMRRVLERRRQQTGQTVSQVARGALELALRAEVTEGQQTDQPDQRRTVAPNYALPPDLQRLLPQYRSFGAQIWQERRRCLGALLAICEVVREQSRNAQDQALCAEILRIGKRFGLLR